ncbi:hypothetical protein BH11ARM1_BH11ARM1_06630 [soil metagenome]
MMLLPLIVAMGMLQGTPGTGITRAYKTMPENVRNTMLNNKRVEPDENGLTTRNKGGEWNGVEQQKLIALRMSVAIASDDKDDVDNDLTAIEKTFAMMNSDGVFPSGANKKGKVGDQVNDTLSFLSEVSPALLQLKGWNASYNPRIDALKPLIAKAAAAAYPNRDTILKRAGQSTNAIFCDARAWVFTSKLLDDPTYFAAGKSLVDTGLSMQNSDGVFIEEGGADTSYHAVSLRHLATIYLIDPDPKIKSALEKGMNWFISRFQADGKLNVEGNTRTAKGKINRFGSDKVGNSPTTAAMTLALLADIFPDSKAADTVKRFVAVAFKGNKMANRADYMTGGIGDRANGIGNGGG